MIMLADPVVSLDCDFVINVLLQLRRIHAKKYSRVI